MALKYLKLLMVQEGQHVASNEKVITLESMKMEILIEAEASGIVKRVYCM